MINVDKKLYWAAGKYVYARGTSTLLHYMALKDFHIYESLDISYLFFIRALRSKVAGTGMDDDELERSMEGTAARPVARLARDLLMARDAGAAGGFSVVEFYPGIGLVYEYLKVLLAEMPEGSELQYHACGPQASKISFEVLHGDDDYDFTYLLDTPENLEKMVQMVDDADLVIYNHNQTIYGQAEPAVTPENFLAAVQAPAVIAVRTSDTNRELHRTTVRGRQVQLPGRDGVLAQCCTIDPYWCYHFIPEFDKDFFLPDEEEPGGTGLLLAYSAGKKFELADFKPVE